MPDKRQESKQRRAARNRANREALAARRENAVISPTPTSKASSASSKAGTARGAATKRGAASNVTAAAPEPPPSGIMGMLQSKRPGDRAVLAAFALAVVAAIYLLFYQVPADDRGEPLPAVFRGLAIAARERLTGERMPDNQVSLLDASGPQILLVLALPIAVTAFAIWANRRADRSRMLTFAMLAMAGSVILTGGIGIFFFPALIALAVGGFRVRKADLPARTAERAAATGRRGGLGGLLRGPVIDADSKEATDADDAAAAGDTEPADGEAPVDAEPAADGPAADEADPLAQLEAELAAEHAAEAGAANGDGADDAGNSGRSRRKR